MTTAAIALTSALSQVPTIGTLALVNHVYRKKLPALPYQQIMNKTLQFLQEGYDTFSLPDSLYSSTHETHFFGVDWNALGREVATLGYIQSLPKILKVFCDVVVRLQNVLTNPLTIDRVMPGSLSLAMNFVKKFQELEKTLISQQMRLHQAKVRYVAVTSKGLPLIIEKCREVFKEIYIPKGPYRNTCEEAIREIYTPYLQNETYHLHLHAINYVERVHNCLPILRMLHSFNKEEKIKESEEKGKLTTRFSDVNLLQLSGSQIIDLFKGRLNTPFTLAVEQEILHYEEKLHSLHLSVMDEDGETKLNNACCLYVKQASDKVYQQVWTTINAQNLG